MMLAAHGLACVLAVALAPAVAAPVVYTLDPAHSFVHFELLHFGTSTLRGRFGPVSGEVTLDRAAQRGELGLRIATGSVDTGVPVLDARLRQPDLLDSGAQPEAFFVATDIRFQGDAVSEVRGEFTLRGVSRPLTLRARRFACRTHAPTQREVCGGDFQAELLRSDFGATYGLPFVADPVRLVIQVEALAR
jgi:polyisoprenoid-binding protein YceI